MGEEPGKRTRASGEVLDYLLQEFGQNHNPLPEQRKLISEKTQMSEKAVRIWFQNRRAKLRKLERMGKPAKAGSFTGSNRSSVHLSRSNSYLNVLYPLEKGLTTEINDKYCLVDCLLLLVGLWQRVRAGAVQEAVLAELLVNLLPYTLNTVMNTVDLMVILLRKNYEINYFFSAIVNHLKILFRIFYPVLLVAQCLLLDNNITKDNNELKLQLLRRPNFSVYFFDGINSNLNQWLICEDFSEGQQVLKAFCGTGGSGTPHVLVGPKHALHYLNAFLAENKASSLLPFQPAELPGYHSAALLTDPLPYALDEELLASSTVPAYTHPDLDSKLSDLVTEFPHVPFDKKDDLLHMDFQDDFHDIHNDLLHSPELLTKTPAPNHEFLDFHGNY